MAKPVKGANKFGRLEAPAREWWMVKGAEPEQQPDENGDIRWWCEWCGNDFRALAPVDPATDVRTCPAGHNIDDKVDVEDDSIGVYPMGQKQQFQSRRNKTMAAAAKPKAEKVAKTKSECLCGCGNLTGGKWFPGHDAKYHGAERKVKQGVLELAAFKRMFPAATLKTESPNIEREAGTLPKPKAQSEKFAALKANKEAKNAAAAKKTPAKRKAAAAKSK